jgi:thioesterase domain-containing protein
VTLVAIGGLWSSSIETQARLGVLAQSLGVPLQTFGYTADGTGPYLPEATCQPEPQSKAALLSMLRTLRGRGAPHAVLVGHSLGGVLAFDVAAEADDLGGRQTRSCAVSS